MSLLPFSWKMYSALRYSGSLLVVLYFGVFFTASSAHFEILTHGIRNRRKKNQNISVLVRVSEEIISKESSDTSEVFCKKWEETIKAKNRITYNHWLRFNAEYSKKNYWRSFQLEKTQTFFNSKPEQNL